MISIVSVPHTGTKFTEKVLLEMGCDVRHAHLHSEHPAQDPRAWLKTGAKIVVPWRDPELARISALNRGEQPRPQSDFTELLEWSKRPNVHLFTVTVPESGRIAELERLHAFVGIDGPTDIDWTPINTTAAQVAA